MCYVHYLLLTSIDWTFMKSKFFLNTSAWQLNLISIILFLSSIFLLRIDIFYFKLAINIWNIFNLIYLNTMSHFIESKIPLEKKPNRKYFVFALLGEFIFFLALKFLCFGEGRLIDSNFYMILLALSSGLLISYCNYYVVRILLIAERKSNVDFRSVFGEYFKICSSLLNIFSIQQRAINGLGYDKNC
jgi:hypothetical protein